MRVVAGTARGRRLDAPPGSSVRPTSDRVREAIFNALYSLGAVDGDTVVDLFAGSGALGIEALSRGATHATFVEQDRAAVAAIRANLERTGLAGRATVRVGDATAIAPLLPPVDLALIDPPYRFDRWPVLLERLPAGMVVIESDREPELPERWELLRSRRYGGTVVVIARAVAPPAGSTSEPPP